jgi:hypothetical protein
MKKMYLLVVLVCNGLLMFGQSQPNNVDIGLFVNGANGSSAATGAYVEVALRVKPGGGSYNSTTLADDFGLYLVAPRSDFSLSDIVTISEVNSAIYATSATTVMIDGGVLDLSGIDDNNWYFPVVLNTAGMNLSSLSAVTNAWSFAFTFKFNNAKTVAAINKLRVVDGSNNTALSTYAGGAVRSNIQMGGSNQLTANAFITLPVSLLNFSGYKSGSKNVLKWTTTSEQNNAGFEVQRSSDGVTYTTLAYINTLAPGGNSQSEISYSYDDNSPVVNKRNYYRLNQKDIDGRSKISNVVLINGDKPTVIGIGGIFPNPASSTVNVLIDAPKRDDVTVVVMDALGKTLKQKVVNVEIGSNTVPVEISSLASGSYLVKVLCKSSDCETAVSKFVKQ